MAFYREHDWDWTAATPDGAAYVGTALTGQPPLMVMAQGHPRTVGRPGRMLPVEANAVDFVGWCRNPAIAVAFDCKVVRGVSYRLDLRHPHKKPDARQVAWLLDWQNAGGLAGYLICNPEQRVVWLLTGTDLRLLAEGDAVVFASQHGDEITTKRLALLCTGRRAVAGGGVAPRLTLALPWDIAGMFRVWAGITAPDNEQGLVVPPGGTIPRLGR